MPRGALRPTHPFALSFCTAFIFTLNPHVVCRYHLLIDRGNELYLVVLVVGQLDDDDDYR